MKAIIMGCGRIGEQAARLLVRDGHDVSVIDYDQDALDRLGPDFAGRRIKGVGFDRDALLEAGIETADAFAATSPSDNVNVVAARTARNIFHVPKVVARLHDPRRAEIYRRLGLITISSTTWGAERIREVLGHAELDPVFTFGRGEASLVRIDVTPQLAGKAVKHLSLPGEIVVVAVTRQERGFIPDLGTEMREGDVVHLAVAASAMARLETLLGLNGGM